MTIESVIELTDEHKTKLINKLSKLTQSEIILINVIKPELLGGIVMRIDNEVIDDSIVSKFNSIEDSILKMII